MDSNYLTTVKRALMAALKTRFAGIISLKNGTVPVDDSLPYGHSIYRVAAYLDPVFYGWLGGDFFQLEAATLAEIKEQILCKFALSVKIHFLI